MIEIELTDYRGARLSVGDRIVYATTQGSHGAKLTSAVIERIEPRDDHYSFPDGAAVIVRRTNLDRWDTDRPITLRQTRTIVRVDA